MGMCDSIFCLLFLTLDHGASFIFFFSATDFPANSCFQEFTDIKVCSCSVVSHLAGGTFVGCCLVDCLIVALLGLLLGWILCCCLVECFIVAWLNAWLVPCCCLAECFVGDLLNALLLLGWLLCCCWLNALLLLVDCLVYCLVDYFAVAWSLHYCC